MAGEKRTHITFDRNPNSPFGRIRWVGNQWFKVKRLSCALPKLSSSFMKRTKLLQKETVERVWTQIVWIFFLVVTVTWQEMLLFQWVIRRFKVVGFFQFLGLQGSCIVTVTHRSSTQIFWIPWIQNLSYALKPRSLKCSDASLRYDHPSSGCELTYFWLVSGYCNSRKLLYSWSVEK
jgi:hypothetical protein